MKRVFSNSSEVAHIWAQQTQSEGRSSNCYFEGAAIYSYGRHYPLGVILKNKRGDCAAIINASGYSVTTAKHIGQARYATNHYTQFSVISTELMRGIIDAQWRGLDIKALQKTVAAYVARRADSLAAQLVSNDAARRKAVTLEKWRGEAASDIAAAVAVLEWTGGRADAATRKAIAAVAGDVAGLKAAAEKSRAAAKRKADKEAKARAAKHAAILALAIPAWCANEATVTLNGENHSTQYAMNYCERVYMRVIGEGESREIETSRRARFPLSHGLRALPLIRAIVASGEAWHRNGKTIHLGAYQIDTIGNGVIKAGCHTLPISEVERLAASLGV